MQLNALPERFQNFKLCRRTHIQGLGIGPRTRLPMELRQTRHDCQR